jgi:hypothetical protein
MKHLGLPTLLAAVFLCLAPGISARSETTHPIPPELRKGDFSCDKATIQTALELKHAGWTYIMLQPKSAQAAWGHRDGRTTWWVGYWTNGKYGATSSTQPKKDAEGKLKGDSRGFRTWRRGGSPPTPTKVEWLCSESGGVPPR